MKERGGGNCVKTKSNKLNLGDLVLAKVKAGCPAWPAKVISFFFAFRVS